MFYTFTQNNSGGSFDRDEMRGIAPYVIVEADSCDQANDRAEAIGLYFDGVDGGGDCSCCGDRWYRAHDGDAEPEIYGAPPEKYQCDWTSAGGAYCFVHWRDGSVKAYRSAAEVES
jgi:hypothetical protein